MVLVGTTLDEVV